MKVTIPKNRHELWKQTMPIIYYILIISSARFFGFTLVILIIPFLIGGYLAKFWLKRWEINPSIIKYVAYSNLLSWIIPIIGLFTAGFILGFEKTTIQLPKKYRILAIIGLILAFGNSALTILQSNLLL